MQQLLAAFQDTLQSTAFVTWVRETNSVLVYPTILAGHTFGMAFLVGLTSLISLRVLGVFPSLPLAPLEKLFSLIWLAFWVNAATGVVLFSLEPAKFLMDSDYYVNLLAIAGAVLTVISLRKSLFADPARLHAKTISPDAKVLAVRTLVLWLVAITAGRLTAYAGFTQWRSAIAVAITAALFVGGYRVTRRLRPPDKLARHAERPASAGY
jgi:hypothetical protein